MYSLAPIWDIVKFIDRTQIKRILSNNFYICSVYREGGGTQYILFENSIWMEFEIDVWWRTNRDRRGERKSRMNEIIHIVFKVGLEIKKNEERKKNFIILCDVGQRFDWNCLAEQSRILDGNWRSWNTSTNLFSRKWDWVPDVCGVFVPPTTDSSESISLHPLRALTEETLNTTPLYFHGLLPGYSMGKHNNNGM